MKRNTSVVVLMAFLNQLLLPVYSLAGEGKQNYAIVYLGKPSQLQTKAFRVLGKRVQTWMENGPFGKVQVNSSVGTVAENELTLEQLRIQLGEYTRTLKKAVLESPDKTKGEKSLSEIKILRKKMNLIGRFGPSLQKSYLAESAFYWKSEKFNESEMALKKAIELDPNGKPTLEDWDMFAQSFSVFAFEKELSRVYQKMNQFCETTITLKQKNAELKVNGFEIKEKKAVRLAANAMHVISVGDEKGHTSESVLQCPKKAQKKITMDLSKNTVLNSEMSLSDAIKNMSADGLFVCVFKKEQLELYFYTPFVGVTQLLLEKKVAEKELAEGAQDFSLPVSYASMNKTLSAHFGRNMLASTHAAKGTSQNGTLEEKFRNSGNKWYNNSILWGVLGGLAVGAATTYVMTREGNSGPPKASVSMELQ